MTLPIWVTAVWSLPAFLIAIGAGLVVGLLVVSWSLPPFRAFALKAFVGAVFYLGQVIEAITSDDQEWPRIVSRFTIWMVYAAAIGVGVWLARRTWTTRKAQVDAP